MIELKGLKKILFRFLKRIGIIEEKRITEEQKKEMCIRAINANACPHNCKLCAWGIDYD